jgi:hypothetical protein
MRGPQGVSGEKGERGATVRHQMIILEFKLRF